MLDFGLVREALEERGLLLTRLAPHLVRPVPFLYPLHHTWERPVRRRRAGCSTTRWRWLGKYDMGVPRHRHLFRRHLARIAPGPADRGPARRDPLLRLPGRRRPAGGDGRPHRGVARRPRRHPDPGRRASCARGSGWSASGPCDLETGRELEVRAQVVVNAAGRVDRRDPGDGRRPRRPARPGQQGHPPRRAARPDPLRGRLHHPDREVGAVRDPVGPALDHRHHRHRLEPRQGAPRRVAEPTSTTCSPTSTRSCASRSTTTTSRACTPGCGRCVRGRPRADVADLPRAHRGRPRCRAW